MSHLYDKLKSDISEENISSILTENLIGKNDLIKYLIDHDIELLINFVMPKIFSQPFENNSLIFWYVFELTQILHDKSLNLVELNDFINYIYVHAKSLFESELQYFWLWKCKVYSAEFDRPEFYTQLDDNIVIHNIIIDESQRFDLRDRSDTSFFHEIVSQDASKLFSKFFTFSHLDFKLLTKTNSFKIFTLYLDWMLTNEKEIVSIFDEVVNNWLYYNITITYDEPYKFLNVYFEKLGSFLSENEIVDKLKNNVESKINNCQYRRDIRTFIKRMKAKFPSATKNELIKGIWWKCSQ